MYLYINYTMYGDYATYDDYYDYCGYCQNCRWKAEWGGMYVNEYTYAYIYIYIHMYLYINYTICRDYVTYDDYYYCGDCQNCRWKAEGGAA